MKYIIQVDVDGDIGADLEDHPEEIQELIGKWQAVNPMGMYFSLHQRRITILLEAPSEESFFEALHATWVATKEYPEVWPVMDVSEFPAMMQRLGMTR